LAEFFSADFFLKCDTSNLFPIQYSLSDDFTKSHHEHSRNCVNASDWRDQRLTMILGL